MPSRLLYLAHLGSQRRTMIDPNYKTYRGWAAEGRTIRAGEHAGVYAANPDDPADDKALFHIDQTEQLRALDHEIQHWNMISTSERIRKKKPASSRLKVDLDGERLAIWCGSNKDAIAMLRKSDFKYNGTDHRWIGYRSEPAKAIAALEAHGYMIEIDTVSTLGVG